MNRAGPPQSLSSMLLVCFSSFIEQLLYEETIVIQFLQRLICIRTMKLRHKKKYINKIKPRMRSTKQVLRQPRPNPTPANPPALQSMVALVSC